MTDGAPPGDEPLEGPGPAPARPESLRRELLAILFLYGVLTVLPIAIGWLFLPATG